MSDRKKITSLTPQVVAAILEILNNDGDAKITRSKTGVVVYEVSARKKYIENAVASGRQ